MGWFSRKSPADDVGLAVAVLTATVERYQEYLPRIATSGDAGADDSEGGWGAVLDEVRRVQRASAPAGMPDGDALVRLQLASLAIAAAAFGLLNSGSRRAREQFSAFQHTLQCAVLRNRPDDFSSPEDRELARQLSAGLAPALDDAAQRNRQLYAALDAELFREFSRGLLLDTANDHLQWMTKTGKDVPRSVGNRFATAARIPRSLTNDLQVSMLVANVVGNVRAAIAAG